MNFVMNTNIWEIKELSQKEICKEKEVEYDPSVGDYFGVTFFKKQLIVLDKDLSITQKRKTLRHELFHCYIGSYISFEDINNWNEDQICDLVANSYDIIEEIINNYFNRYEGIGTRTLEEC